MPQGEAPSHDKGKKTFLFDDLCFFCVPFFTRCGDREVKQKGFLGVLTIKVA
jgi:hypothetical protein